MGDAESVDGADPFTPELLVELGRLVEADWVSYCELDRVRRRVLVMVDRPGDEYDDYDDDATFWDVVVNEHPVCLSHQLGSFEALKVSDFLSRRALHATRLYDLWFRPHGIEDELSVPIPSPLWHTKTFLFDRRGARSFTERDKAILDALQPHLARLWEAARTRRLLEAALDGLERAATTALQGVVLLDGGNRVAFATASARALLGEFFPGARTGLPWAVEEWLEAGAATPLEHTRAQRRLRVTRANGALLLEARQARTVLTAREREVLSWVARGKTNDEVARLLWLAPSTVRKHLENAYGKLGVNTRTAAVAHFLGLIDAEAS